jgi:hypothetical protein
MTDCEFSSGRIVEGRNLVRYATGRLVNQRYVLEQIIGRGGMAVVWRAVDTVRGRTVALKQLTPGEGGTSTHSQSLFEREFHTLAELAHPRIVEALDYGIDDGVPYYTMELLDGGDLLERAPLSWRAACAAARDICSALSLVHSRRLVFRDLSPRNVRCTEDGKAKLLDFGALAPMGPSQVVICTPAVAAPEVVHGGSLDGRTDLYALGVTLYRTLLGRNPYAAQRFDQLPEAWKRRPLAPSDVVAEIPRALDELVLDMLQLDPDLRPASAAEVLQRLSAIAGLKEDEELLVSRAYLTTPTLVGRDAELLFVDAAAQHLAKSGAGSASLIVGPRGVGRSRFLDAAVMHAKMFGLAAIRTSAADVPATPLGVIQGITTLLLQLLPGEVCRAAEPHVGWLSALVPALDERGPTTVQAPAPQGLAAQYRDFLLALARQNSFLLAVDDIDQLDAESLAFLALLAREAQGHSFVLLMSRDSSMVGDSDAERSLFETCSYTKLECLRLEQTQLLFASIFGEVPNLSGLVRKVQRATRGNPQGSMRLAQQLIDRGLVNYHEGAWVLPEVIDPAELPDTLSATFAATVDRLDDHSRALASALALGLDERFSEDECLSLSVHGERRGLLESLAVLQAAGIVLLAAGGYTLASRAWVAPLRASSNDRAELALARVFEQRGDGLRAARHLFAVGLEREGLDVLVKYAEALHRETSANPGAYTRLLASLPRDWLEIFESGLARCAQHNRCARDLLTLQNPLSGILSQSDVCSHGRQAELAQRLWRAAGLDLYEAQDPSLLPVKRLQHALGSAAQRFAATADHDRLLDPQAAIGQLVRTVIAAIGSFSRTLEFTEWRRVPSLAPLAPISPGIALVERLARGFDARASARFEDARTVYQETLQQLASVPEGALDKTFVDGIRGGLLGTLGTLEAVLGLESSEARAAQVAEYPIHRGSALAIRLLAKLWLGDTRAADRLAREREIQLLERPRREAADALILLWGLQAHAASDDLTRTRQSLEAIERAAHKMRSWEPVANWARGEHARICGDSSAALRFLDAALEPLEAAGHQIWPLVSAARLRVLCELKRDAEAQRDGALYLASAQAAGLGYVVNYLRMPLALAAAKLGDSEAATAQARAVIESFEALGARGLNLGLAHENAARVALLVGDMAAFDLHEARCKAIFSAHGSASLATKYRRLRHDARRLRATPSMPAPVEPVSTMVSFALAEIGSRFKVCTSAQERFRAALDCLVQSTAARAGFLYASVGGRPSLRMQTSARALAPSVETLALQYLEQQLDEATVIGEPTQGPFAAWDATGNHEELRPVLLSHQDDDNVVITGLAVLEFEPGHAQLPAAEIVARLSTLFAENNDVTMYTLAS